MNAQNMYFAIVIVKMYIINSPSRENFRRSLIKTFGNIPIILAAEDSRGVVTCQGRRDIVNYLEGVDFERISWKEYTLI